MSLTLSEILPHLLHTFKSESDLVRAINELSNIFNQDRDKLVQYGKDARLVSAYTAFYALTNIPKLEETLKWFPQDVLQSWSDIELIDVGAGPGTMSLAWMSLFPETKEIYVIEQSTLMKEQAAKIFKAIYPDVKLRFQGGQKSDKKRIALFGHSLNEMGVELGMRFIRDLNPDYILFIEPGMLSVFPQMLAVRDELIKSGHKVLFPCLGQGSCPLKENPSDWCHQYLHVKQNPEVERLTQLASKDRRHLPITVHLYAKDQKIEIQSNTARVFRSLPETKFSMEMQVCFPEGHLELKHFQIYKKHYSKKEQKEIEEMKAGDLIQYEVEKELPEFTRVKIIKCES